MRVRISDIPAKGLNVKDTISLERLNQRMTEGRGNDIEFIAAPEVEFTIFPLGNGGDLKGEISALVRQPCSRCLKVVERKLKVELSFALKPKPDPRYEEVLESDSYVDDVGLIYFDGEHVELEETLQESLILTLSPFWHPDTDKNGACCGCGEKVKDLIEIGAPGKVTLGELMKGAKKR